MPLASPCGGLKGPQGRDPSARSFLRVTPAEVRAGRGVRRRVVDSHPRLGGWGVRRSE